MILCSWEVILSVSYMEDKAEPAVKLKLLIFWSTALITRSSFYIQFWIIKKWYNMDFLSFVSNGLPVTRVQFYWVCLLGNIISICFEINRSFVCSEYFFFFFNWYRLFRILLTMDRHIQTSTAYFLFWLGKWSKSNHFQRAYLPLQIQKWLCKVNNSIRSKITFDKHFCQ